ncbi:MAG TPA: NAD-glutamate dehydrogenase, partial [Alphaproteobacteria bacterium]|nr:NAD-glutamate dehydrogenase [Alphaproteobacteria bacterium]
MPDDLLPATLKALPKTAPDALKSFAQTFVRHTGDADLEPFDARTLSDLIQTHWALAHKHKTGTALLALDTLPTPKTGPIPGTTIDVVSDDMAFLVDSIAAEINRRGYLIACLLHPIIEKRSHIHIRLVSALSTPAADALQEALEGVLSDVRLANRDWPAMLARLKAARDALLDTAPRVGLSKNEIAESCAFLDYMIDNNFTLLGCRDYAFSEKNGKVLSTTLKESGLGVLSDARRPAYISGEDYSLPESLTRLRRAQPPLSISKTNRRSTVHRAVPMDTVTIKTYAPDGSVCGEHLFVGLFTSVTYSRSVEDIPWLRAKVEGVMKATGFAPGSHDWRALRHILEKYPRDELFQIDPADLKKTATGILTLQERQRIALYMREDPFGRYVSCLVYVPRDRYETRLRRKIQVILEDSLHGTTSNFYTTLDDSLFARVMFVIAIDQRRPSRFDTAAIELQLQEAGRTWSERIEAALVQQKDLEDRVATLHARYREAFPAAYQETETSTDALRDIDLLEKTLATGRVALELRFAQNSTEPASTFHIRLCAPGQPVALSDILPLLENAGLRVIAEIPYELTPRVDESSPQTLWLQDFHVAPLVPVVPAQAKLPFEILLEKVWNAE